MGRVAGAALPCLQLLRCLVDGCSLAGCPRMGAHFVCFVAAMPLYADIVKNHGSAITMAAKEWVDRYRDARGAATAELLTFLLQVGPGSAAGLKAVLYSIKDSLFAGSGCGRARPAGCSPARAAACRCCILRPLPRSTSPPPLRQRSSQVGHPYLLRLLLALQACGVDYTLTEEVVEEGEVDAVREALDTLAQQVGAGGWSQR